MFSYDEARRFLIDNLTSEADAQDGGSPQEVGRGFDVLGDNLPGESGPEFGKLFVAINFWDGWVDARNHGWQYYEGIRETDWPVLARRIAKALAADREITEPIVIKYFDLRDEQTLWGRIKSVLARLRGVQAL